MRTKIGRWGKSLAVRIPATFAKKLGLQEDIDVDVSLVLDAMPLRPATKQQYSLEELVSKITPENRYGETDWGHPAGRET